MSKSTIPHWAPDTYDECNKPRTVDEINASLEAFAEEVYELRKKHLLPDMLIVFRLHAKDAEGNTGDVFTSAHVGNELMAETLAAWAMGNEQKKRQERIAAMVGSGGVISPKQRK